jgi:cyclopropane fatty-acyl-phospholipid synthase-like methyltransferase
MSEEPERRSADVDYGKALPDEKIKGGHYRTWVGGEWETHGPRQLEYLVELGLQPGHRLLDVGCGALRGGRHFVDYLDAGNYYGVDINETLLDAGYERELTPELQAKLPRDHLRATERFDVHFDGPFDFAIAQSLFSHVSFNQIRLCLYRVAKEMQPGGRFLSTFFIVGPEHPLDESCNNGMRWTERNVFFYYYPDLGYLVRGMPWQMNYIGDWEHPRGQMMVEYLRLEAPPGDDAPSPPQS